jgi:hypothetical protein
LVADAWAAGIHSNRFFSTSVAFWPFWREPIHSLRHPGIPRRREARSQLADSEKSCFGMKPF